MPFIFLSGAMGEEFAIETLHQRADYVLKGRLSKLVPAVERALQNAEERRARKEADAALRDSAERFRNMTESAQDGIVIIDDNGLITDWNSAAERMFGYRRQEVLGKDMHALAAPPRYLDDYRQHWPNFRTSGRGAVIGTTIEAAGLRRDGGEFPVELSISAAPIQGRWHAIGIIRDISERKRGERALQRSNRFLRTLSRCNETLIHATDEFQLLRDMCRLIVEVGEFPLAWVGYVDSGQPQSIAPMAWFGEHAEEFVADHKASWPEEERLGCPMCVTLNTGDIQTVKDISAYGGCAPCQVRARLFGYCSSIFLPLKGAGGTVVGALAIYARETDAFGRDEYAILAELAADLAFGITTLRERGAREESARQLERALEGTIQAIATTIEARDPYTAGHQKRAS
ncbi:PAS domain S-box protein, partial [Methylogaea oryzae]|uniref:PAS domain S-box protein n=1 Tax=Methylogaea oryzae TaxID=1295382 RepID=UPI000AC48926